MYHKSVHTIAAKIVANTIHNTQDKTNTICSQGEGHEENGIAGSTISHTMKHSTPPRPSIPMKIQMSKETRLLLSIEFNKKQRSKGRKKRQATTNLLSVLHFGTILENEPPSRLPHCLRWEEHRLSYISYNNLYAIPENGDAVCFMRYETRYDSGSILVWDEDETRRRRLRNYAMDLDQVDYILSRVYSQPVEM
jgi:hypothetical protein